MIPRTSSLLSTEPNDAFPQEHHQVDGQQQAPASLFNHSESVNQQVQDPSAGLHTTSSAEDGGSLSVGSDVAQQGGNGAGDRRQSETSVVAVEC